MKALAVIGQITQTLPIEGADFIISATVTCGDHGVWDCVVQKTMQVGDRVLVCLQDALVPDCDRFKFMEPKRWRVKMCKFKGVASECLAVPLAPGESIFQVGTDVTDLVGVTKYEKPQAGPGQQASGDFLPGIPKTDEINYQKVRTWLEKILAGNCYATIKHDGMSGTVMTHETGTRVASRNYEIKAGESSALWQMVEKYSLNRLEPGVCLQFELVGPAIQSNKAGFKEKEVRVFGLFFQEEDGTWIKQPRAIMDIFCSQHNLPATERVSLASVTDKESLRALVDSVRYPNGAQAEGIVVSAEDQSWSFKVISLNYKD